MDSFDYLNTGAAIVGKLFEEPAGTYYGQRSPFYAVFLHLLRPGDTLWAIPLAQGFILSYVLFHCFRLLAPRGQPLLYLAFITVASITTSTSWFASLIMPDLFLSTMVLALFLVSFCRSDLSTFQLVALFTISIAGILFHNSHLAIAILLVCAMLGLLVKFQSKHSDSLIVSSILLISPVLLACVLMVEMSTALYGKRALFPQNAPYILAKSLEDGPGRMFLEQHCNGNDYALCSVADQISGQIKVYEILWHEKSIFHTAPPDVARAIREEELRFVVEATLEYPVMQISRSVENFIAQLLTFTIVFIDEVGSSDFVKHNVERSLPGQYAAFSASAQYRRNYVQVRDSSVSDLVLWDRLHLATAALCAGLTLVLLFSRIDKLDQRLKSFSLLILFALVANAAVTGVLSQIHGRYQSKVVWLIILPAFFLLWDRYIASAEKSAERVRDMSA
jgi:hypothetical protein